MQIEHSITGTRSFNLPLTTCPACQTKWLTPGLAEGDSYECKDCGSTFIVHQDTANPSPVISSYSQSTRN